MCLCLFIVKVYLFRHLPSLTHMIRRPPLSHVNSTNRGRRKSVTPSLRCSFAAHPGACDALICPHEISLPLVRAWEGFNRRCVLIRMTSAPTIGCRDKRTHEQSCSAQPRPNGDARCRVPGNKHAFEKLGDFSAVREPWRGPVCRNMRGVEFIYSVRRSSYSHMDRPTVISLDCTAPNKSASALTALFLTCCETMM